MLDAADDSDDARLLGCGTSGVELLFVGDIGALGVIASAGILYQK